MTTLQLFRSGLHADLSDEDIWSWYNNIIHELALPHLDDSERAYLMAYYSKGLLSRWRRPFFRRHFAKSFWRALLFLCEGKQNPLIVDLGCGTGSQSLAFALCGARVIALDLDVNAVKVLEKRKNFYEEQCGQSLNITIIAADTLKFDFADIGPIDGVYSLFAFNLMQPTHALLARLMPGLTPGARLAIQDGNRLCWLGHLPGRRRQVLSPLELNQILVGLGFKRIALEGNVSIPPLAWAVLPYGWLSAIDSILNRTWLWPVSYLAMYQLK